VFLTQTSETFQNEDQSWLGSARGTDSTRSVTLKTSTFTSGTHYPNGFLPSGLALALPTTGANAGFAVPVAAAASEVQTVTITGTPTGGTFTVTFDGATSAGIAFDATAAAVQTALEALSTVNPGDVAVTGGPGPGTAFTVTFGGRYAGLNVPAFTASGSSLTGGTSPGVTIATATAGGSGVTDGSDVLAGYLFCTVKSPSSSSVNVVAALLDTGRIVGSKLPIAVTANVRATNPRFTYA
jgi:hypothetical protein